ncbi:MAG: sigma-70 family RNA polymerase sigma factor [Balneolaceae bacterium]|nr:MAG: sigma-70 family RNA polymerase sigma factor [Balneolaceae bacterium]
MKKQVYADANVEREATELLFRDASAYLEKNQRVIRAIVLKYSGSGLFAGGEVDDVIQHINERMLTGILNKMRSQYKPMCRLMPYFSKIVSNLCLEYAKKDLKRNVHEKKMDFSRSHFATGETMSEEVAMREIFEQLEILLNLYGSRRSRIELLFKISLRIGITEGDVLRCYPHCSKQLLNRFLLYFNDPDEHRMAPHSDMYGQLIPLINELEGTNRSADALRKSVDIKLDEIAEILNISPINAALNRETVKILLENYYSEFPKSMEIVI